MARSVSLTDEAAESLDAILHWYTQRGAGRDGIDRVRAILAAITRLGIYPFMGRVSDQDPTMRELVCRQHRIIYLVEDGAGASEDAGDILVLDIFGPGEP